MAKIEALKGFSDMFASDAVMFTHIEAVAREVFSLFSYQELRTPILESTSLFARSIGEDTDVVGKEMYTFQDKGNRSVTLRPEATAGVIRAFVNSKMYVQGSVYKLFTTGPMFRYERPQKGRFRQFHQINCECLGADEPENDAEMIYMLHLFLNRLGIYDFVMQVNSLGCSSCRPVYREKLSTYLEGLDKEKLCTDCQRRMQTNPLRVLDCKVPTCAEYVNSAPKINEFLCADCSEHFDKVLLLLKSLGIEHTVNTKLVRGLDYYTRTAFEAVSTDIGSQSSIAGGGRYDGLVKQLGGGDVSGIGFACGMERLAMLANKVQESKPVFYLATLDAPAREKGFNIVQELRSHGIKGEYAYSERSVKSLMRQADKSQAEYALILGENEIRTDTIIAKNMATGEQKSLALSDLAEFLKNPPHES